MPTRVQTIAISAIESVCGPCYRPSVIVRDLQTVVRHHYCYRLELIGRWVLHISDKAPPEYRFIIIHVHCVIRLHSGLRLADFKLPSELSSLPPAARLSSDSAHSHPISYSSGRSAITTVWTLSAGSVCVLETAVAPPTPALHLSISRPAPAALVKPTPTRTKGYNLLYVFHFCIFILCSIK